MFLVQAAVTQLLCLCCGTAPISLASNGGRKVRSNHINLISTFDFVSLTHSCAHPALLAVAHAL